jgi:hypothetical protein
MGGYGFPREGRFSITWKNIGDAKTFSAFTAMNGKFYASTNNNELLEGSINGQEIIWKRIGVADNIHALTSLNNKLYAVSNKQLLIGSISQNNVVWKKIAEVNNVISITSFQNSLYVASTNNTMLIGSIADNALNWKRAGNAGNFISMTADKNHIYAVNSGDTLWSIKPMQKNMLWAEIGRNNGFTYTISIKHIAVLNNRLYAVGADDKIYIAEHNTNNNLTARALAIRSNNKTVVLVGLDVTGFSYALGVEVKAAIYKKYKIPAAAILINASHTHFAPVTQAWTTWADFYHVPDSIYLNKIVKKALIRSIEQALDHMSASELYFGRGEAAIGYNRRNNAAVTRPYDSTLDVIKIASPQEKIKSVLFLTACHPVFKNEGKESYTLSANYPGVAKKEVEEKTGSRDAIFIQGCAGDVNPKSNDHWETGEDLTAKVMKVLAGKMTKMDGDISYAIDQINIPVKPWTIDSIERFRKINETIKNDVYAEKNVRWADLMLGNYKKGMVANSLPLYIQTINIGNWKLVALSREVVNEYGPAIRKLWTQKTVTVAGYSNDVSSYLPISWHIEEKFYEGYDSFLWYGQPGIPDTDVLEWITNKIKKFNR